MAFHRAMENGYVRLKLELSYHATYFKGMIDADGGVAAAKQPLGGRAQDYSEGFTTCGRRAPGTQRQVLRPVARVGAAIRENARWRLRRYHFDLDVALRRHADAPARYPCQAPAR
jgi:hypothetical protein